MHQLFWACLQTNAKTENVRQQNIQRTCKTINKFNEAKKVVLFSGAPRRYLWTTQPPDQKAIDALQQQAAYSK